MPAHDRTSTPSVRRVGAALSGVLLCAALAACQSSTSSDPDASAPRGGDATQAAEKADPVRFALGVRNAQAVPIGQPVELTAEGGELTEVAVTAADGTKLAGKVDGGTWLSTGRLEPGTDYVARSSAVRSDGQR